MQEMMMGNTGFGKGIACHGVGTEHAVKPSPFTNYELSLRASDFGLFTWRDTEICLPVK
jgi:hypothetical protein